MRKLAMALIMIVGFAASAHEHSHHGEPASPPSSESVFNLTTLWTDQDGKPFHFASLKGSPSVIAMAYTSCQSSCPLIVEDMRKIAADVAKKSDRPFHLLLFTFDSKRDRPEQLKKFAKARKLDPKQWTLLHGSPKAVRELAAVLGIRYKEDAQGEFDHSNVITLVDSNGIIKSQLAGVAQPAAEFEKLLIEEINAGRPSAESSASTEASAQ